MAKVPFSKLQAKLNNETKQLSYYNATGEIVQYEVKYYLPFAEKLELISNIINQSIDDNGFYNPMRVKFNMVLEVTFAYTNLSFTEKMKEDPFKLYDILISTGIFANIIETIRPEDWTEIQHYTIETINNIYTYRNSVMGILEAVSTDYSNLNLDVNQLQTQLANTENLDLLKDILTKLG